MAIDIIDQYNHFSNKELNYFKSVLKKLYKLLDIKKTNELCITFTNDRDIRALNREYRSIDRATDVLSFTQDGPAVNILGDIVISFQTASRNSVRYKRTLNDEILHLIVHGVLHLIGYDHKKKTDRDVMREKEEKLLGKIKSEN